MIAEEGQQDEMESVCADTVVIFNGIGVFVFVFLSKLEEKVSTDGQLRVGL